MRFTLFPVLAVVAFTAGIISAAQRPNIMFILVDDLGWSDLGCYGHPWHQTPNIDRLADQGMRFTNGYSPAPICSAARASILTGKAVPRLGFEFVTKNDTGHQRLDSEQCDTPVIGYDMFPTFVKLAGSEATGIDGISIARLFENPEWRSERSLIWHFPYYHPETTFSKAIRTIGVDDFAVSQTRPQSALRRGKYKIIRFAEDARVELYDLEKDIAEQHDLSDKLPNVAAELDGLLEQRLNKMKARRAVHRDKSTTSPRPGRGRTK